MAAEFIRGMTAPAPTWPGGFFVVVVRRIVRGLCTELELLSADETWAGSSCHGA